MNPPLTSTEVRVLGALMEKDMTTPEYYPLSLNALVNACNQKNNRDPVVHYGPEEVEDALESLRRRQLVLKTTGREVRVPKYSHRASETLDLGNRELAVMCVLLLRGPQTIGEIKDRTERMYAFDDLGSVETTLRKLMERQPEAFAAKLEHLPGARDPRYAQLLAGEPQATPAAAAHSTSASSSPSRVDRLESELAALRSEVEELRRVIDDFRRQFE